jgi:hypothetical protein
MNKLLGYRRFSFLAASTIWSVILTISTEILNLFHVVNIEGVTATWVFVTIMLFVLNYSCKKKDTKYILTSPSISAPLSAILVMVIAIVSIIGIIAVIAPPNTWDSMAYHMARVAHWIQNQSVDHYAASYLPQLYLSPWAEFAIMHLQILSGSDRFANCIQWWSMIGSIFGVSMLAKLFGADIRGQIMAAAFAASIPMGIVQGSSTQNDYVVTFWLICFLYFSLHWLTATGGIARIGNNFVHAMSVGMSIGLAIMTKGTAYIYAFPFVIWFTVLLIKQYKIRALQYGLLIAFMILLLNIGHYSRNLNLFGSPISVGSGQENLINQVHSLPAAASNIIRNLSLHLGTPSVTFNDNIYQVIRRLHDILNIDINDIRTTSWGKFKIHKLNTYDGTAGNPIHLILIVVSTMVCFLWKTWKLHYRLLGYIFSLIAGFTLFSILLKWQPFHSRLQLPLFVLFSPLVGLILAKIRPKVLGSVTVVLVCISALPWVFFNKTRLLLPASIVAPMRTENKIVFTDIIASNRMEQYFSHELSRELKEPYTSATAYIKSNGYTDIGLWLPYDPWEYQLWVMLKSGDHPLRIESVMISNISKKFEPETFIPSAIIRVRNPDESIINELRTRKGVYLRQWSNGLVDIFIINSGENDLPGGKYKIILDISVLFASKLPLM